MGHRQPGEKPEMKLRLMNMLLQNQKENLGAIALMTYNVGYVCIFVVKIFFIPGLRFFF